jgi:hypothetical protein
MPEHIRIKLVKKIDKDKIVKIVREKMAHYRGMMVWGATSFL